MEQLFVNRSEQENIRYEVNRAAIFNSYSQLRAWLAPQGAHTFTVRSDVEADRALKRVGKAIRLK